MEDEVLTELGIDGEEGTGDEARTVICCSCDSAYECPTYSSWDSKGPRR